jgi:hypothetical protein
VCHPPMDAGQHHGPVTAPPMAEWGWGTGPLSGFMGPPRVPCEQPYEQIRGSPSALIDLAIPGGPIRPVVAEDQSAKRTSPSGSEGSRPDSWSPGPSWVRTASGPSGSRRAPAVRTGRQGSQVTGPSRRQPPRGKRQHGGFEPLSQPPAWAALGSGRSATPASDNNGKQAARSLQVPADRWQV